MNLDEFFSLVRDMRIAQKEYFRNRDKIDLSKAKNLERKIDEFIKEHDQPKLDLTRNKNT